MTASMTRAHTSDVVVIDDDPDVRTVASLSFQLEGWSVASAPDGMSGVELLEVSVARGVRPTVILDVQMPGLDGWQVLTMIRCHPELADLPVLLCTVMAGDASLLHGYSLGADGFVAKPFEIDALVSATRAATEMNAVDRMLCRARHVDRIRRR